MTVKLKRSVNAYMAVNICIFMVMLVGAKLKVRRISLVLISSVPERLPSMVIVTTANDGTYIDSTGDTGRARYTDKVCEAGTMNCSNEVTVTFQQ